MDKTQITTINKTPTNTAGSLEEEMIRKLLTIIKPRNQAERIEIIGEAIVAVGFIPAMVVLSVLAGLFN